MWIARGKTNVHISGKTIVVTVVRKTKRKKTCAFTLKMWIICKLNGQQMFLLMLSFNRFSMLFNFDWIESTNRKIILELMYWTTLAYARIEFFASGIYETRLLTHLRCYENKNKNNEWMNDKKIDRLDIAKKKMKFHFPIY